MPRFDTAMQSIQIPGGGNFQFSATRPELLGATEYTLVTVVVDVSYSVQTFAADMLSSIKAIVAACQQNPRADNLMIRVVSFSDQRKELHGFIPLTQLDANQQYPHLNCGGATALYDATYDAVGATNVYAKSLFEQDFDVNAAIYIITDGQDNRSGVTPKRIAQQIAAAQQEEYLESLITILVGVNTRQGKISSYLERFKDQAQLTQYVDISNATPDTLAKLAAFVNRSISAQSQALGTGGASNLLTF